MTEILCWLCTNIFPDMQVMLIYIICLFELIFLLFCFLFFFLHEKCSSGNWNSLFLHRCGNEQLYLLSSLQDDVAFDGVKLIFSIKFRKNELHGCPMFIFCNSFSTCEECWGKYIDSSYINVPFRYKWSASWFLAWIVSISCQHRGMLTLPYVHVLYYLHIGRVFIIYRNTMKRLLLYFDLRINNDLKFLCIISLF